MACHRRRRARSGPSAQSTAQHDRNGHQRPGLSALAYEQEGLSREPDRIHLTRPRRLGTAEGAFAMTDRTHRFKVGQSVDLVQSMSRSAAAGHYEILSLRPAVGE